jgi:hypothetical protein
MAWRKFKAFFRKLAYGGTIDENVKAMKEAEKLAKIEEAAKLKTLIEESGSKTFKTWAKYQAKQIPSYLFSFITGDIGDIFYRSFDTVKLAKDGSAKVVNLINKKLFGKFIKATRIGIATSKGVIKLAKTAENTIDTVSSIGKGVGNVSEGSVDIARGANRVTDSVINK